MMRISTLLVLACLGMLNLAQAADTGAARRFELNIPRQPLEAALKEFAAQTGLQIARFSDTINGKAIVGPLKGQHSAEAALKSLLAPQGLHYKVVNDRTIAVISAKDLPAPTSISLSRAPDESLRLATVQQPQPPQQQQQSSTTVSEDAGEMEVSSTKIDGLNKKSIFDATEEGALPYNVIDREEIARSGAVSFEELMRYIPELAGYGNESQSAVGSMGTFAGVTVTYSTANLRGMGATQTVILVNGRRLGNSGHRAVMTPGVDISRIPLGSIERIEILPASAAAIYGGGAVGGAINIILRKDTTTHSLETNFGTSTNGGGTEIRGNVTVGTTFNEGRTRLTTNLDFSTSEALRMDQRDYTKRAMEKYGPDTPYMANSRSAFEAFMLPRLAAAPGTISINAPATGPATRGLGIPGNPNARYAAIPAGLTEAQANLLTPASFTATAGTYRAGDYADRSLLIRPQKNYNLGAQLEHDILDGGRLSLFVETSVSLQTQDYSTPTNLGISLPGNHPFNPFRNMPFVNANGVASTGIPINVHLATPDIDTNFTQQDRVDARLTVGLKGKITERWDWTMDFSGQYGDMNSFTSVPHQYVVNLQSQANPSATFPVPITYAQKWAAYNLFQDHTAYPLTPTNQPTFNELWQWTREQWVRSKNAQASARVVGTAWELPAGPLTVSPGAEMTVDDQYFRTYRVMGSEMARLSQNTTPITNTPQFESATFEGAFIEAKFPVFSRKWRPVPVEKFEVGVSRRWEDSNRAEHSAATDTLSAQLEIVKDVSFRASRTEGFVLDRFATNNPPTTTLQRPTAVSDPLRGGVPGGAGTTIPIPVYISGQGQNLRPENSRTENLGVQLRPRFIPGLMLSIDRFKTVRKDTPGTPTVNDLLLFPDDFPGRVERAPLTDEDRQAGYTGGSITRLDVTQTNLALLSQTGIDYRITYSLPVPEAMGTLDWTVNANNVRSFVQQLSPTRAPVDLLGAAVDQPLQSNRPLEWRGSSSLFWQRDRLMVGVTANYVDSYLLTSTFGAFNTPSAATGGVALDGPAIPRQITYDLQLGFQTASSSASSGLASWISDTYLRVGIRNVLDTMPAFVTEPYGGMYSRYGDPRQRFVYVNLRKNF